MKGEHEEALERYAKATADMALQSQFEYLRIWLTIKEQVHQEREGIGR